MQSAPDRLGAHMHTMNRIEVEQGLWVERYLAGRLDEQESRRFEAYWDSHPELVDELETCARLKLGLDELRATGELAALQRPAWWQTHLRLVALAASVGAVALIAALWQGLPGGSPGERSPLLFAAAAELPALSAELRLPVASTVSLLRLRSRPQVDGVVTLPDRPAALQLRVLPDIALPETTPDAAGAADIRFTVVFSRIAGAQIFELGRLRGLRPAADGFVDLLVDARGLSAGRYRIELQPTPAAATGASNTLFTLELRGGAVAR